jgi:hypothetical protein
MEGLGVTVGEVRMKLGRFGILENDARKHGLVLLSRKLPQQLAIVFEFTRREVLLEQLERGCND